MKKRPQKERAPLSMELLQKRELLAADFMWQGDVLQISGSEGNDFIAVQQDMLGTKVFTEDAFHTQHEGRSFNTAKSISVSGLAGDDILASHQISVPVTLSGNGDNDFLYADKQTDVLDGGDGFNWIYGDQPHGEWENAFGIDGLNLSTLSVTPQIDVDDRVSLEVEVEGEVNIDGQMVDIAGVSDISSTAVDATMTGSVSSWESAFGITGLNLRATSLTLNVNTTEDEGSGYRVDLSSRMDVDGTEIGIDGSVDVNPDALSAELFGSAANWDDAFGIAELDLRNAELAVRGSVDSNDETELSVGVGASMLLEDTLVDVNGSVDITPERIDADFHSSIDNWNDAFGIEGLTLENSELNIAGYTDRDDDYQLQMDLLAEMEVDDRSIEVSGNVDITPDRIDALFNGSVGNWDDAFGIDGLELNQTDLAVSAYTNRSDEYDVQFELDSDMDIEGTNVQVNGTVEVEPSRTAAMLTGFVAASWNDAFGIQGLTLNDTNVSVSAIRDDEMGSSLSFDVNADMDVSGTNVAVVGTVDANPDGTFGSLTGTIDGEWARAMGLAGLDLIDTTISAEVSKTPTESELALGLGARMDLLGRNVAVDGTATFNSEGVTTTLTGTVEGEWIGALGIDALQLQDTILTVGASSSEPGLDIDLDTDLQLFGSYIDVVGNLDISPSGVDVSFSPPGSLDFVDLLGIPGFSLEDSDLVVSAGTDGLEVAVVSTMEMGDIDVDFEGAFAVSTTDVSASLTGRVNSWDNAFAVPGLNLDNIVMTLGAESGIQGASMYIGLGAGIDIGTKELDVAGLVGFGATGWEVAFRGEIDSLTSVDLVDFANTITQAGDPDAPEIPSGVLGDFEMQDAYINFAPYGRNEALGIEDGFGIGGDFYEDGELLAGGEFAVDLAQASFEVGLDIPELDLGPVDLSDVLMDIRIAPFDSYQKLAGRAELMGANVQLAGELNSDGTFLLTGSGAIRVDGLAAAAAFTVDNSGILFDATASGAALDTIKGAATGELRAVSQGAQAAIDDAQAVVNAASTEVRRLESDLKTARTNAQKEVDKIKADINSAQSVVNSAKASKDHWYGVRKSRYNSWRSAIKATNRAVWYNKPHYKAIEAGKYSSYLAAAGTYSAKVVAYDAAVAALKGVRAAAGWALDAAGVEANPEVIRIKALLETSNIALDAASTVLSEIEKVNADAMRVLDIADSLRVRRITLSGDVSNYVKAGVAAKIDFSFAGGNRSLTLRASTEELVDQLTKELMTALV